MAFRNELISNEDQERIHYHSFKDMCGSSQNLIGIGEPRWTVDREKDAYLLKLGGGMDREDYHVPHYFLLSLRGEQIRIDAFRRRIPSDDPRLSTVVWEVIALRAAKYLSASRDDIARALAEAFAAYGSTGFAEGSHINLKSVLVDFSRMQEVASRS